jgi:hypothetical protein
VIRSFTRLTRVHLYRWAAALVLAAGYADLAAGGMTLAPLLLVVAYLALVPLALLVR